MAPILPIISAIGGVVAGVGSIFGTIAAVNQAKYERSVAEQNAAEERKRAALEAERYRRDSQRRLASTRASYAASGVELAGSPLAVLGDAAAEAFEDEEIIRHGGAARAMAYQNQANAAGMRATSSLIGGVTNTFAIAGNAARSHYDTFGYPKIA